MKIDPMIVIAAVAGTVIGALASHVLHAQTKPLAYVISEIDVTDKDAYAKE
jgi:hypothetical protein